MDVCHGSRSGQTIVGGVERELVMRQQERPATAASAMNRGRAFGRAEEDGVHNGRDDLATNFTAGMVGCRRVDVYISPALENGGALRVGEFHTAGDCAVGAEGTDMEWHEVDQDAGGGRGGRGTVNVHVISNTLQAAVSHVYVECVAVESEGRSAGRGGAHLRTFRRAAQGGGEWNGGALRPDLTADFSARVERRGCVDVYIR